MSAVDWNEIYNEHGRALLMYARQWTRSVADAEDVLQDAFLKVFKADKLRDQPALPLLYKAIKWVALDRARSTDRRRKREDKVVADSGEPITVFESDLETDERRRQIEAAMRDLSDEQREVLTMKIWGDLSFREIGEALDVSLNTAASRYRYAIEALRGKLKKENVA